ncbi:hypothetical protein MO973_00555 [Paenibacillus sp. TRM 82003]|nr:hypothetical protein [Paenibacillus sp. TRM 82003]
MRSEGVDPRDVGFEVEQPVYRVHFWQHTGTGYAFPQRSGADLGPAVAHPSYASDEHRLQEARDVEEVLTWARAQAAGRVFVVYAEVREWTPAGERCGLLRLHGQDPDDAHSRPAPDRTATARSAPPGTDVDPASL